MKKWFLTLLVLLCIAGHAQTINISFTGRDVNTGAYVQLSRVEITNQTRGWTNVLTYPDTVATLTDGTGIDDNSGALFGLSQNTPNPFSRTTYVSLSLPEGGAVTLEACDVNGRTVVLRSFASLQPGTHALRVNLATAGVYLLIARQGVKVSSVRMVNQRGGGGNSMELVGFRDILQIKGNSKDNVNYPFAYGDSMIYKGYSTISGLEFESETVAQTQLQPETITLYFSAATLVDAEPCPGTATVTDHEGNIYNTVQIGNQCWMKENMRCTTSPSTGTSILESSTNNTSYTGKKAYYVNGDSTNTATYGLLYNWNAAIDMYNMSFDETSTNTVASNAVCVIFSGHRRGICPAGWHLPSDTEWVELTTYVYENGYQCPECSASNTESSAGCIAKALASQTGWDSDGVICAVGNDSSANNATGFSGVPTGIDGNTDFGHLAYYWSSTQSGIYGAFERNFNWHSAHVHRHSYDKYHGFSVRCVRGVTPGSGGAFTSPPSVTTGSVSYFTATTATCSSTVTTDGGANVTARGVCWNTLHGPTVLNSHTTDGTGAGSFSSSLTGLTAGTTYYVRAYATNNDGTTYGAEVCFTTISPTSPTDGDPCPGISTVTDHEGNVYHTVQIGDQCWMRENMRCTTSPSTGTLILEYSTNNTSYTGKKAYYVNGDSANTATYGLLYNWNAAVDTFNATYGETSTNTSSSNAVIVTFNGHRKGICPAGWHLPSDAEWTQLTTYAYNNGYKCPGCSGSTMWYVDCIAKALASQTGWNSSDYTCEVGNNPSSNNNTGFSAVPAGYCYLNYYSFGALTQFWSATQVSSGSAYGRSFGYESQGVGSTENFKSGGFSVRCVHD